MNRSIGGADAGEREMRKQVASHTMHHKRSGYDPQKTKMKSEDVIVDLEKLLRPREAADLLCVSERTLWSETEPNGDLPVIRIGRCKRYDPRDIEAYKVRKTIRRNRTDPSDN